MAYHVKDRQKWLDCRLKNLEPSHFFEGTAFFAPRRLRLPEQFQQPWACAEDMYPGGSAQGAGGPLQEPNTIVLFADPGSESDIRFLGDLVQSIEFQGTGAAPVFLVPHSVKPGLRRQQSMVASGDEHFVMRMIQLGLDGIVAGEPEGVGLAVATCGRIARSAVTSASLEELVNLRRSRSERLRQLKDCIHYTLWGYLRVRIAPCLPAVDPGMEAGIVSELDGYRVGRRLGGGTCGVVLSLSPISGVPEHAETPGNKAPPRAAEVIKVVGKETTVDLGHLRSLNQMIEVMELLSSDQWKHPNIVQTYMTYHSRTHLYFRMESGGDGNLFQRLASRCVEGPGHKPLSLDTARSLISQALEVISFLQSGPQVCHRDIKPENMCVGEAGDTVTLKLCDFDLAIIQRTPGSRCNRPCGTFPFVAPEVMLGGGYHGFWADTWSLGVVILEILCGSSFLDQRLNSAARDDENLKQHDVMGQVIRRVFERPGAAHEMLHGGICGELEALTCWGQGSLERMLNVVPERRCSAEELLQYSRTVWAFAGEACAVSKRGGGP